MTIQDMGAVGEMIGGIAVIITLIYLTLQIRQNTRAVRLNTGHAVTEEFRGMFELVAGSSDLAELISRYVLAPDNQQLYLDAIGGIETINRIKNT